MQTRPILQGTINDDDDLPRQAFEGFEGFREALGLLLRQAVQGIGRDVAMPLQHLGELRLVKSRKPCRFFESMFRGHDHQKEQITDTDPLETLTDSDLTCNPGGQRVIWHGVSPLMLIRCAWRGVRYFESRHLSMGVWPKPGTAGEVAASRSPVSFSLSISAFGALSSYNY